jgi:hypothetical protein
MSNKEILNFNKKDSYFSTRIDLSMIKFVLMVKDENWVVWAINKKIFVTLYNLWKEPIRGKRETSQREIHFNKNRIIYNRSHDEQSKYEFVFIWRCKVKINCNNKKETKHKQTTCNLKHRHDRRFSNIWHSTSNMEYAKCKIYAICNIAYCLLHRSELSPKIDLFHDKWRVFM